MILSPGPAAQHVIYGTVSGRPSLMPFKSLANEVKEKVLGVTNRWSHFTWDSSGFSITTYFAEGRGAAERKSGSLCT